MNNKTKLYLRLAALITTCLLFSVTPCSSNDIDRLLPYENSELVDQEDYHNDQAIRIGYFHGGRTILMIRAYEKYEYREKGIEVELYSRSLREKKYTLSPHSINEFNIGSGVGKVRGTDLIDALLEGNFDCATVGENSFVQSLYKGKLLVAIAELGHDVKGHSGHVILMHKGLKTERREDFLGKVLVSRRAGPGDSIFLKEYLQSMGVDIEKDILQLQELPGNFAEKEKLPKDKVLIVDDLFEDLMNIGEKNKIIDGGYFHLMGIVKPFRVRDYNIIQALHQWADPELSLALLVCKRDFIKANRARLISLLEVNIERIKYEHSLSYEERTREQPKGLQMATNFHGLNYPQYDLVPTVDVNLLNEVVRLLKKYKFIDNVNDIQLDEFIDNSLVIEALKNLNITEKDDYWQSEY